MPETIITARIAHPGCKRLYLEYVVTTRLPIHEIQRLLWRVIQDRKRKVSNVGLCRVRSGESGRHEQEKGLL